MNTFLKRPKKKKKRDRIRKNIYSYSFGNINED